MTKIQLFPPLLLRPDRGGLYFKVQGPDIIKEKSSAPNDLQTILAFDPGQYVPDFAQKLYRGSEAWAVLRCAVPGSGGAKLTLTASLFDKQTREKVPMALTHVARRSDGAIRTFLVRIAVPDVEPDDYTFLLSVEDETTGAKSEIACDFAIEDAAIRGDLK